MEIRSVIILAIITNTCHKIDSFLSGIPRDTEVKVNDSTYLNCSTSLLANQVQWRHGNNYVHTEIAILEPYNERFSVEIDASTGACNLIIRSVQPSDAGTYECAEDEGFGEQRTAQLIVLHDDPVCESNMHSDGVIGPNSCGIEPEEVKLSCSVKYHGNILPVLQWKSRGDNQSLADGRFNATSINEATYSLTMKSTLGLNNTSYICQTTRTSSKHYSCSSNAINIIYIFSSKITVNMTMNDEVNCQANASQSCSYRWKWFNGDDISTESENSILKPKKGGMHRCEVTCSIRNESCSVQSMHATVHSEEATSGQNLMLLLVLLLVPALAAVCIIVYWWKKRQLKKRRQRREKERLLDLERRLQDELEGQRREEEERKRREEEERKRRKEEERKIREEEARLRSLELESQRLEEIERQRREEEERKRREEEARLRSLGLIATIRTKAEEEMQKRICGLTILDSELFVVNEECSEVEVYDWMNFSLSRQWTLKELIDPLDIVSCHRNKCIYISDFAFKDQSYEIFRVDSNGKLIKKWSTKFDFGSLSVTYDSNVILVAFKQNKLNEYSPDGQLIREIHLPSDEGLFHPQHAIKLTNGHFVVSHGEYDDDDDDLHRVCIVDGDGHFFKSFGGKRGSTIAHTNTPLYLSVDGSGSVMVADYNNSRVLLLDSDLEFEKEILSHDHGLRYPNMIFFDESNSRLFASDYEPNNSRIMIFDLDVLRQTRNLTLHS